MTRKEAQPGLTLVELIVAMTLTVMVSGSTVAILRSTNAAQRRANTQLELQQQARAAVLTMASALANVNRYPDRKTIFEGIDDFIDQMPADRISFSTISQKAIRLGQPESDVKQCEFYLASPPEKRWPVLMRRTDPTRNEEPDQGGVIEIIAENILGLNIIYHDGTFWRDDWPQGTRARLLAVRIELAVATETDPPELWTTSRIVTFPHFNPPTQSESQSR